MKNIIIIALCVVLSALFAAAETSFFSISKVLMKKLEKENIARSKRILFLLKKPKQLLITTLLGSTLVNILATSYATLRVLEYTQSFSPTNKSLVLTGMIITMTIILLIIGEIIPKLYAYSSAIRVASFTSYLIYAVRFILYPIIIFLELFTASTSKKKNTNILSSSSLSHEDIQNIVQSNSKDSPLEESEKKIIAGIFRFPTTTVKEIMVPRVDIQGIELSASIDAVQKVIIESGYSRIPVYKKTIDDITGVIYAKDLIISPHKTSLLALQRKVLFITENMKIQTLLAQFQSKKKLIAIVVDEYGGTSGLVTLEDILEELVGEIMDEYDDEQPMITKLQEKHYLVSAMIQVSAFNREFNTDLNEDYDNLADFLYSEFNQIPQKNEQFIYHDSLEFTISHLKNQRINFVRVKLIR